MLPPKYQTLPTHRLQPAEELAAGPDDIGGVLRVEVLAHGPLPVEGVDPEDDGVRLVECLAPHEEEVEGRVRVDLRGLSVYMYIHIKWLEVVVDSNPSFALLPSTSHLIPRQHRAEGVKSVVQRPRRHLQHGLLLHRQRGARRPVLGVLDRALQLLQSLPQRIPLPAHSQRRGAPVLVQLDDALVAALEPVPLRLQLCDAARE